MKKNEQISIGVLGLWHLGCIYAASFAKLGYQVVGYDNNTRVINQLKRSIPPILEPGLAETIKKHLGRNMLFSSSIKETLSGKKYLFVTYDVPVDKSDKIQIAIINKTFSDISKYVSPETIIVISSQVPIGTSKKLVNLLKKNGFKDPRVIYFPENLRLGNAFKSFLEPDRIVLGSNNNQALEQFKKDFKFACPILTMNLESAEMSKHALNSYLATCISFSSELSDLSEKTGANMSDVVKSLKTDRRVSPYAPINPGLGFAGGTLGRDIQSLKKIAKKINYEPKLLNAVYTVNQNRLSMLYLKIKSLYSSLKGKGIGILGLTYTPNTNTLRRSMSLELAIILKNKECVIKAFDPAIKQPIPDYPFINISSSLNDFFQNLDVVILMTEWPEFKEIDVAKVAQLMNNRRIIDTKNFLSNTDYLNSGFTYLGMGARY